MIRSLASDRGFVSVLIAILVVAVVMAGREANATNLLGNHSFESGNTGFESDYTFTPIPPSGTATGPGGTDVNEGEYSIVENLVQAHDAWAALGTLAAQSRTNYFVADGSSNAASSPWIPTVYPTVGDIQTSGPSSPVCFRLEGYVANLYPISLPDLAFEMMLHNSGSWQSLTTSQASTAAAFRCGGVRSGPERAQANVYSSPVHSDMQ